LDLLTGEEVSRLRGHVGTIKALQVETYLCTTGTTDGVVRLWDLRRVDGDIEGSEWDLSDILEEAEEDGEGVATYHSTGTVVVILTPYPVDNIQQYTCHLKLEAASPAPGIPLL
jgi:hypothetical protein